MHDITEPRQVKRACTHCRNNKIRCSGGNPCTNCSRRGRDCSLSGQREYTNYRLPKLGQDSPSLQPNRPAKESYYLHLYWKFFHPRWSFIHRSSFSEHETPLLIQSMVVLGLWISQEPNAEAKAIELHNLLGSALRDQAVRCTPYQFEDSLLSIDHRTYGTLSNQGRLATPARGPSRHTRQFYCISYSPGSSSLVALLASI